MSDGKWRTRAADKIRIASAVGFHLLLGVFRWRTQHCHAPVLISIRLLPITKLIVFTFCLHFIRERCSPFGNELPRIAELSAAHKTFHQTAKQIKLSSAKMRKVKEIIVAGERASREEGGSENAFRRYYFSARNCGERERTQPFGEMSIHIVMML